MTRMVNFVFFNRYFVFKTFFITFFFSFFSRTLKVGVLNQEDKDMSTTRISQTLWSTLKERVMMLTFSVGFVLTLINTCDIFEMILGELLRNCSCLSGMYLCTLLTLPACIFSSAWIIIKDDLKAQNRLILFKGKSPAVTNFLHHNKQK